MSMVLLTIHVISEGREEMDTQRLLLTLFLFIGC